MRLVTAIAAWMFALTAQTADAQIQWSPDRYFPAFPEPDTVDIFEVPVELPDQGDPASRNWRVYDSPSAMHALTLATMQGLINREKPSVFLVWRDPNSNPPDIINPHWATIVEQYVTTVRHQLSSLEAIGFLYQKHAERFSGAVIYDPDVADTINLATMIAAIEGRVMLAPDQLGMEGIPEFSDVVDLRQLVIQEGWDSSFDSQLAIYQWVYDNLWPDLDHRIVSMESPGPPTGTDRETPNFQYRPSISTRDYVVALKIPALYLNPKYPDHEELLGKFFDETESPGLVLGGTAFNEFGMVRLGSSHGLFQAAVTWPGEWHSSGNLTVLGGIRPPIRKASPSIDELNIFETLGTRPIATLSQSDGDAIFYQMARGFLNLIHWENVQGQNFGWETNPVLAELSPAVWNYYQDTNDEVSFTSGLSGSGYIDPFEMDAGQLERYLQRTAAGLEETGLKVVRFNGMWGEWDSTYAAAYYDNLHGSGHVGTIIGFHSSPPFGTSLEFHGRPTPAIRPMFLIRGANALPIADFLARQESDRDVIEMRAPRNQVDISDVDDDSASGSRAMLISSAFASSQSCCLAFETDPIALPPGAYTVTTRLKVADNTSGTQVAATYAGSGFNEGEPQYLGSLSILADEFQSVGEYQEFSYTFELDELTRDVRFRFDYGDAATTDLFADNILVKNDSVWNIPVMAYLHMFLGIQPEQFEGMETVPRDFAEAFESQGGLVVTPDEFFASVNPEYMIDLGRRRLGDAHPSVVKAQTLFDQGDYFRSLSAIRGGLQTIVKSESSDLPETPEAVSLEIFPNPFNESVSIDLMLSESNRVKVTVHDVLGRKVTTLHDGPIARGRSTLDWTGKDAFGREVASGLYFVRFEGGRRQHVATVVRF